MKESLSNAFILNLIIIFLFIFIILFAGSTAYTKAFKVKNRIISIIEKNELTVITEGIKNQGVLNEIDSALSDAGYTIVMNNDMKCKEAMIKRFKNTNQNYNVVNTGSNTYRYCIAEFYDENSAMHGKYYAVVTYMYFEVPLIGAKMEFPVYGETKTMGIAY